MNTLKKICVWLGPLGIVVFGVVLALFLRDIKRSFSHVLRPTLEQSIDTMIVGLKETKCLKPYKVITGGFAEECRTEDGKGKATLTYQYKGMAEYSVDLSSLKCVQNEGVIEMILRTPVLEMPIMLKLPVPRLFEVQASPFFRKGYWEEKFRRAEGELVAKRIRSDVDTPENLNKAKDQTEKILRYMLASVLQDGMELRFVWE